MMLSKLFDKFELICICILLAFMSVMTFINVVARSLAKSFSFTEEITIIAFTWVSMLGIAEGYKCCAHLGMSYFVDKLPQKFKPLFVIISTLSSVIMMLILLVYGIEMVQQQIALHSYTPSLHLPQYVQGLSMPVGAALILIRVVESGYHQIKLLKKAGEVK
jgi:C4-dicarboxylate transporter DctQ subunit